MRRTARKVWLDWIAGASPLNPRAQESDCDLAGLKASILANGLLQPILVETREEKLYALDGSRRLRALRELADEPNHIGGEIDVVEIEGTEAELREVALAANFHRLDLHPVEKFEAFATLAQAGRSIAEIADHFNLTQADVKRALALGRLAPIVRIAWKEGKLSAEAAQAFAVTPDQARQAEIFGKLSETDFDYPPAIRRLLRGDAVVATSGLALFARAEYEAAGGRVDESLFEEQSFLLDGELLRRLADEKLARLGEEIRAAEGWGWVSTSTIDRFTIEQVAPVRLNAEEVEILKLRDRLEMAEGREDARLLTIEIDAIEASAFLRAVPAAERADYGIFVAYDSDGFLDVERGFQRSATASAASFDNDDDGLDLTPPPAASALPDKPNRAAREILDRTISTAFADCVSRNVNLSLALAVAAMGRVGPSPAVHLRATAWREGEAQHELLDALDGLDFADAVLFCLAAPFADLTAAFCVVVARAINAANVSFDDLGALAGAIDDVAALDKALARAFDPKTYFASTTKEAALSAIADMLGEAAAAEAGKLAKKAIADKAARAAADKAWLPFPLDLWAARAHRPEPAPAPEAAPSLAAAMLSALAADVDETNVRRFLEARTIRADGQRLRATDLHEAFVAWCVGQELEACGLSQFGRIATRCGVERYRHKTGIFYLGVRLAEPSLQTAAE